MNNLWAMDSTGSGSDDFKLPERVGRITPLCRTEDQKKDPLHCGDPFLNVFESLCIGFLLKNSYMYTQNPVKRLTKSLM